MGILPFRMNAAGHQKTGQGCGNKCLQVPLQTKNASHELHSSLTSDIQTAARFASKRCLHIIIAQLMQGAIHSRPARASCHGRFESHSLERTVNELLLDSRTVQFWKLLRNLRKKPLQTKTQTQTREINFHLKPPFSETLPNTLQTLTPHILWSALLPTQSKTRKRTRLHLEKLCAQPLQWEHRIHSQGVQKSSVALITQKPALQNPLEFLAFGTT